MPHPVNVLVWGTAEHGACAYFRGHLYDEPLAKLGVNIRHVSQVRFKPAPGWEDKPPEEVYRAGMMQLDTTETEWADVVMFRRYYNTAYKCRIAGELSTCTFVTLDENAANTHEHGCRAQDSITRDVWPAFRDSWTGGIVYETDDDHWAIKPWNGYYPEVMLEQDMIADMARRADVVTVSTAPLARKYGRFNPRIRVIRNAIDPDLYVKTEPRPEGDKPRLVYYGSTARLRDYAGSPDHISNKWEGGYARRAVDAHAHLLHRVFMGTNRGTERIIDTMFDEQHEYLANIPEFCAKLANLHGDIGIAPLGGDDFDLAKSELHWLEYALTDMAFIGQRYPGSEGPYNVVRPGVDGLLARGAQEWHDAVKALTRSKDLRVDLAGAAKERVLRDYDFRDRAEEWAEAFRFAAENPGIGKRNKAA